MYKVTVSQSGQSGTSGFGFNKITDALEFIQTCLECGDKETWVTIQEIEED